MEYIPECLVLIVPYGFKSVNLSTYQLHNIDDDLDKLSNGNFCDDGKSLYLCSPIWYPPATYVIRAMCGLWFNISKVLV